MKQLVATETDIAELSSLCSAGNSSILVRHGQSSWHRTNVHEPCQSDTRRQAFDASTS